MIYYFLVDNTVTSGHQSRTSLRMTWRDCHWRKLEWELAPYAPSLCLVHPFRSALPLLHQSTTLPHIKWNECRILRTSWWRWGEKLPYSITWMPVGKVTDPIKHLVIDSPTCPYPIHFSARCTCIVVILYFVNCLMKPNKQKQKTINIYWKTW